MCEQFLVVSSVWVGFFDFSTEYYSTKDGSSFETLPRIGGVTMLTQCIVIVNDTTVFVTGVNMPLVQHRSFIFSNSR
jgi:hypothetical protein